LSVNARQCDRRAGIWLHCRSYCGRMGPSVQSKRNLQKCPRAERLTVEDATNLLRAPRRPGSLAIAPARKNASGGGTDVSENAAGRIRAPVTLRVGVVEQQRSRAGSARGPQLRRRLPLGRHGRRLHAPRRSNATGARQADPKLDATALHAFRHLRESNGIARPLRKQIRWRRRRHATNGTSQGPTGKSRVCHRDK